MEQGISIERMEQAVNIFGSFDENIRLLEKEFNVTVTNRDGELRISGEAEDVMHAAKAVQAMLTLSSRGRHWGSRTSAISSTWSAPEKKSRSANWRGMCCAFPPRAAR